MNTSSVCGSGDHGIVTWDYKFNLFDISTLAAHLRSALCQLCGRLLDVSKTVDGVGKSMNMEFF